MYESAKGLQIFLLRNYEQGHELRNLLTSLLCHHAFSFGLTPSLTTLQIGDQGPLLVFCLTASDRGEIDN